MPWADYSMVKEIGSGSFGRAYLVQINPQAPKANGKDKQLVLKEIDLSGQNAQQRAAAEVEVKVLSSLKHPYIVKYWESFTSREKLCIVMDYCEGGDLWQYIAACKKKRTTIPETHVVRWFTQMCLALKYIHEKNVLHRDLKTQNVFLTRKDSSEMRCAKIADFGIAKVLKDQHSMAKTLVGTPYYLSPEICQKQPYGPPSDVWAVGCILFELCALRVPFDAKDLNQLVDRIVRSTLPRIPASYSRELGDLGAELLTRDARQRPSAGTILQRPIIQTEIKRMLAENKGSQPAGGTSNEAEQVMPPPMSAREPRAPSLSARESREPRAPSRDGRDGRRPLGEHNPRSELRGREPSREGSKQRVPSGGLLSARAPSPHKGAAREVIRPSRVASPTPRHR